jgi:UDP-4-amino-4,6-dideoxy-N-acetyl-beta-L-altrosamine transaminase
MLPYGRQHITDADVSAVSAALRDPMLTQGPKVDEFEQALAEAVGARYAVAVNSGTAALHAAYFAAGVQSGVTVATTPITFVATANASYYLDGGVRLADIDRDTALLDPNEVERLGDGVRVVTPVHFGGQVADLARFQALAARRNWIVVEDAAHALGARYTVGGREFLVGACAHSQMCCFSFHPVKHITTGEGGAVTTNDTALRDRLVRFRTHGITRDPAQLEVNEGPWYYEQHDLGFNYRITDVQCALGLSQLQRLDHIVARRREIAAQYDALFAGDQDIRPTAVPPWSKGSYHLYVVTVPASVRRAAFDRLRAAGIGVNVHYIPVHKQPYQRQRLGAVSMPNAEAFYAGAISLPMFPELTSADVERVVAETRKAVRGTT